MKDTFAISCLLKNNYVQYEKCFSFCYFSHHHSRHPRIYRFDLNLIFEKCELIPQLLLSLQG